MLFILFHKQKLVKLPLHQQRANQYLGNVHVLTFAFAAVEFLVADVLIASSDYDLGVELAVVIAAVLVAGVAFDVHRVHRAAFAVFVEPDNCGSHY